MFNKIEHDMYLYIKGCLTFLPTSLYLILGPLCCSRQSIINNVMYIHIKGCLTFFLASSYLMLGPLGWVGGCHTSEMSVCECAVGRGGVRPDGREGEVCVTTGLLSVQPPSCHKIHRIMCSFLYTLGVSRVLIFPLGCLSVHNRLESGYPKFICN